MSQILGCCSSCDCPDHGSDYIIQREVTEHNILHGLLYLQSYDTVHVIQIWTRGITSWPSWPLVMAAQSALDVSLHTMNLKSRRMLTLAYAVALDQYSSSTVFSLPVTVSFFFLLPSVSPGVQFIAIFLHCCCLFMFLVPIDAFTAP